MFPSFADWRRSLPFDFSTWRKDRASSPLLLCQFSDHYLPQTRWLLWLKLQNPLTNLEAIQVWQIWILGSFLGSLFVALKQAFVAVKHFLFFHVIIHWNHIQNMPSLTPLHARSNCWVSAVYPSIWVYSSSKLQTDFFFFKVDASNCYVS